MQELFIFTTLQYYVGMASFKAHIVTNGTNRGNLSADFRGENFIGHEQGDEHHTVFEIDPIPDDLVDEAISAAQGFNQFLVKASASVNLPDLPIPIPDAGNTAFLRFGVWDE